MQVRSSGGDLPPGQAVVSRRTDIFASVRRRGFAWTWVAASRQCELGHRRHEPASLCNRRRTVLPVRLPLPLAPAKRSTDEVGPLRELLPRPRRRRTLDRKSVV